MTVKGGRLTVKGQTLRKLFGLMEIINGLVILQLYTSVKINCILYLKLVNFIIYKLYLNKTEFYKRLVFLKPF